MGYKDKDIEKKKKKFFENVEVPPYIRIIDKDNIAVITVNDWEGTNVRVVQRDFSVSGDMSGYWEIETNDWLLYGKIGGDWRNIRELAEQLSYYFEELEKYDFPRLTEKEVEKETEKIKKEVFKRIEKEEKERKKKQLEDNYGI